MIRSTVIQISLPTHNAGNTDSVIPVSVHDARHMAAVVSTCQPMGILIRFPCPGIDKQTTCIGKC